MPMQYRVIKTSVLRVAIIPAILLASAGVNAQSFSPWLPIPGSGSASVGYVSQSGDTAYVMGDTEAPISGITGGGANRYKRDALSINLGYGISDALSVDARLGYAEAQVGAADNSSGLDDVTVGLNWRVLDEYSNPDAPTVTLRVAGIVGGDYDGARLAAIGKDASGIQMAAIVGRQVTPALGLWGSVGFESRNRNVPTATFFDLNAAYSVTPALGVSVGYSNKRFGGDLDIAGPGFSPDLFQQVSEERATVRLGVSYAIAGNQSVSLNLGRLVSGSNTVKDDRIIGVGYSIGF